MAQNEFDKKDEKEEKWRDSLSSSEARSLEQQDKLEDDVDEDFHIDDSKKSETVEEDWKYIDDGFDAEIEAFKKSGGQTDDKLNDISQALSTWRVTLGSNKVLDDLLESNQDVPTAVAFSDMIRLIDEYEKDSRSWSIPSKEMSQSLKKLKSVATRLNETMMKAVAETHSDITEDMTYLDMFEVAKDPVSYRAQHLVKQENKRVFDRLNTYQDEIRGEADMSRVVSIFFPEGQGDKWTNQEKTHANERMDDYSTKTEESRRPYLDILTKKMYDIAIGIEMFTPSYMAYNLPKMEYLLTQLSYFEDVRNDPLNAPYFYRLSEKEKKKLDIIDYVSTSFTTGDFVMNMNNVNGRERWYDHWYKPDARDQIRLDAIMDQNSIDDTVNQYTYDTKQSIERLRNDRI